MIAHLSFADPRETLPREIPLVDELDSWDWSELQGIVRSFQQSLRRGERVPVEDYLAGCDPAIRGCLLVELIQEEIEYRLNAGESVDIASYLEQFPEMQEDRRALAELEATAAIARQSGRLDVPEEAVQSAPSLRLGRYELRELLGRGSFGDVYRAWDRTVGREVAIKRHRPGCLPLSEATDRFECEARRAAVLRHPHIVPVYLTGQVEGEPYLVSELVEGKNLAEELAAARPSFRQAAEWVASLAIALDHVHQNGMIHRDVKPSNILIDGQGHALLTDFGLAKLAARDGLPARPGQLIGTPAYMAPEQARGEDATIDGRTDVYSLGVVFYELLAGVRPFQGSERMLLARIQEEEPTPPRRFDDAIPLALETICLKCLRKLPSERYSTAMALSQDLSRYLAGEPIRARSAMPWKRAARWTRRQPAVAALLVLCVSSALGMTMSGHRPIGGEREHVQSIVLEARGHAEDLRREVDMTPPHDTAMRGTLDRRGSAPGGSHRSLKVRLSP